MELGGSDVDGLLSALSPLARQTFRVIPTDYVIRGLSRPATRSRVKSSLPSTPLL
jgi:hypothetical protein